MALGRILIWILAFLVDDDNIPLIALECINCSSCHFEVRYCLLYPGGLCAKLRYDCNVLGARLPVIVSKVSNSSMLSSLRMIDVARSLHFLPAVDFQEHRRDAWPVEAWDLAQISFSL